MFFSLILILFVCYISIMVSICKIYREKTIEVGVYIDRHLYKNMEEVFPIDIHHTFGPVYRLIHLWKNMEEIFNSFLFDPSYICWQLSRLTQMWRDGLSWFSYISTIDVHQPYLYHPWNHASENNLKRAGF